MAAGEPYVQSQGDAFLFDLLSADPLLGTYLPGGVSGERPSEDARSLSIARFWLQSPGTDVPRQDGRLGRALSTPTYVVVALDRQRSGADKVYGTVGGALDPRQPYLQLAQRRIYALLHGLVLQHGGLSFAPRCAAEYPLVEETKSGARDVQLGWLVRMDVT